MRWYWETAVEPLLEASRARTIVEVGVLRGVTTAELLEYAERVDGIVHGIDPSPFPPAVELADRNDRFVLHRGLSLDELPQINGVDAALIDGDHNWYTVISELRILAAQSESEDRDFPLTFLHDVGWPYGRRDQYHNPRTIPREHRQPMARGGLWPTNGDLQEDRGVNIGANHATSYGTPRNGVLTAVEDFVAESDGRLELTTLPGLHGLGIVVSRARLEANDDLRKALQRLDSPEWLRAECARLEEARLLIAAHYNTIRRRMNAAEAADAAPDLEAAGEA